MVAVNDDFVADPVEGESSNDTVCTACGLAVRNGDDLVIVGTRRFHNDCVIAPVAHARRRIGAWAAMGSRGQMAMGDVQRDPP